MINNYILYEVLSNNNKTNFYQNWFRKLNTKVNIKLTN